MARIDTSQVRTTRDQFNELFGTLATYFRMKTTSTIDTQYYERIKFFPSEALRFAMDRIIEERRPATGNFPRPSGLANLCFMWLDNHPDLKHRMTIYDRPEDLEYPYKFLEEGFNVLMNRGLKNFGSFLRNRRMPRNDVVRVLCKAAACSEGSKEFKAELSDAIRMMGETEPNVSNGAIQDVISMASMKRMPN